MQIAQNTKNKKGKRLYFGHFDSLRQRQTECEHKARWLIWRTENG